MTNRGVFEIADVQGGIGVVQFESPKQDIGLVLLRKFQCWSDRSLEDIERLAEAWKRGGVTAEFEKRLGLKIRKV